MLGKVNLGSSKIKIKKLGEVGWGWNAGNPTMTFDVKPFVKSYKNLTIDNFMNLKGIKFGGYYNGYLSRGIQDIDMSYNNVTGILTVILRVDGNPSATTGGVIPIYLISSGGGV